MKPFEWWQNKKQKEEILQQIAATTQRYKTVFSTEDGKWVLEDLAKRCYEHITTFNSDAKMMAFNEGRRSVYKYIKSMIDKDLRDVQEELTSG